MVTASMASPSQSRLAWLDALRGGAALAVALHHAGYVYLPDHRVHLADWFDPGLTGVLVFFMVSGYIIPASLERRGSVRGFWIGRFFRIYPLLVVTCVLSVLPVMFGMMGLRAGLEEHSPATAIVAHMTMLQDLLDVPNALNVLWTLSYEMAFYLLVVALFVVGGHRRSAATALVLTAGSLIAVALTASGLLGGAYALSALLSRTAGTGPVVAVTAVVLVLAIGAAVSGRPALRTAGGLLGGLLAVVLVVLNGRVSAWQGIVMLALMFAGTTVHRVEHGQTTRRAGLLTVLAVVGGAVAAGIWHGAPHGRSAQLVWCGAVVVAAACFAAAWRLRHRRFPRWATGLGMISFSVYLLHPLLLRAAGRLPGAYDHTDIPGLIVFVAVLLALSWAAYRWIEAPAQRLGRRLTRPARAERPARPQAIVS